MTAAQADVRLHALKHARRAHLVRGLYIHAFFPRLSVVLEAPWMICRVC